MFLVHFLKYGLLAIGGLACILNVYFSFLRRPLHRVFGWPYRWVSGVPLFGSLFVVVALFLLPLPSWLFWLAVILSILDTGGLHWFAGTMFWYWLHPPHSPESDHTRTA